MPYKKFYTDGADKNNSLEELEKLLSNPAIHVLWKVTSEINSRTFFHVFYEDRIEALKQEQQNFMRKLKIAKEVAEDENYIGCEEKRISALKNITRRKLESYNKLVDAHNALEEAIMELCDIDTQRKILRRKKELQSKKEEHQNGF